MARLKTGKSHYLFFGLLPRFNVCVCVSYHFHTSTSQEPGAKVNQLAMFPVGKWSVMDESGWRMLLEPDVIKWAAMDESGWRMFLGTRRYQLGSDG